MSKGRNDLKETMESLFSASEARVVTAYKVDSCFSPSESL